MINFKKHPKGFYYKTLSGTQVETGYRDIVFLLSYFEETDTLQISTVDPNQQHLNEKNLAIALRGLLHFEVMLAPEKVSITLNKNDNDLEKLIIAHHMIFGYAAKETNISQFNKTIFMDYAK